jgi:hypothetical protein
MSQLDAGEFVVFHGELNPQLAHVYVQLPSAPARDVRLRGYVHGPRSRLTRTLPASVPLTDLGAGPSVLARALVPDPCYWGPAQPYLYDVEVELCRGNRPLLSFRQTLGVRSFGLHGCRLLLESRPWTLVGCYETSVTTAPYSAWRESQAVRVVVDPSERVCQEASEEGVMLVAELRGGSTDSLAREVHRLGKWAAVMLIVVGHREATELPLRARAPNVLLATHVVEPDSRALSPWAHVGLCDLSESGLASRRVVAGAIPWMARRRLASAIPLEEAVEQCRRLYEEIAPLGACLGCLV